MNNVENTMNWQEEKQDIIHNVELKKDLSFQL